MIIWTRWGILAFLFFGIGVGLGFALKAVVGLGASSGAVDGVFVGIGFLIAAGGLYAFERFVVRVHLDKPRALYVTEQLAEPVPGPDGRMQTQRSVPAVHPETGVPVVYQPRSSLFFIPMRFWPFILGGIGVVSLVVNLVGLANT